MRYIDADALYEKLYPLDLVDKRLYTINAKAVADAIANTPTADVVPRAKIAEIFEEIESEIEKLVQDALNCQEEYKSLAAKPFIILCEGKLTGLGEAKQVISQLKKKYTEENK